jgi:hypothetical protein
MERPKSTVHRRCCPGGMKRKAALKNRQNRLSRAFLKQYHPDSGKEYLRIKQNILVTDIVEIIR